ncbi:hypothetical protein CH381_21580 [Leptospira sp. mixed culture ATI2-C-A1]|nr:hypothetical protein CH381_21580 [Leptospira sp. mixed culture ATI2-C-A1]
MKYIYLIFVGCCLHCSFADLDRYVKPFPKESTKTKISDSITILNQNRMYYSKEHTGWVETNPLFGGPTNQYFSIKQKEIGHSRYHWKDIHIYNIDDKNFQLTDIKTDFVFFVTANRPRSDWEEGRLGQVFQLVTLCIFPCHQKVKLEVTVKLFYKNSLLAEKVSTHSGTRYFSPWYIPLPFLFQMRDYGNLVNEPNAFSTMYLQGFQEAIDEIYLTLPKELAKDTEGLVE